MLTLKPTDRARYLSVLIESFIICYGTKRIVENTMKDPLLLELAKSENLLHLLTEFRSYGRGPDNKIVRLDWRGLIRKRGLIKDFSGSLLKIFYREKRCGGKLTIYRKFN